MTTSLTSGTQDLSSILTQVKGLEEEKAKLLQLLETERERLKEAQAKAEKMSEGKRTEMKQALDTVIMNWLQDAVKDEKVREEFKAGMSRLADDAKDDAGVWQVVCCASNVHAQRLQEIERMRVENEELKSRGTGDFRDEASRKRGREEVEGGAKGQESNIWLQFEQEISTGRTFGTAI
jgi:regulator of replication initiation timing